MNFGSVDEGRSRRIFDLDKLYRSLSTEWSEVELGLESGFTTTSRGYPGHIDDWDFMVTGLLQGGDRILSLVAHRYRGPGGPDASIDATPRRVTTTGVIKERLKY